jgi:flagellum-specific peptidoglycan hydrolase FlgJ
MAISIAGFVDEYGAAADYAASRTGLTSAEILGQWGLETGWGESFAGLNNVGNVSPGGKVANYATLESGVSAYVDVINRLGLSGITDAGVFGSGLQNKGYATDPDYAAKIAKTVGMVEKVQAGESGVTGRAILGQLLPGQFNEQVQEAADSGGFTGWLDRKAANWGLIIVGVILGVSALIVQTKSIK